jgi:hypothetical protein
MGVSARAMLAEIAAGQTDPKLMADLARGRMRNKGMVHEGTEAPLQLK